MICEKCGSYIENGERCNCNTANINNKTISKNNLQKFILIFLVISCSTIIFFAAKNSPAFNNTTQNPDTILKTAEIDFDKIIDIAKEDSNGKYSIYIKNLNTKKEFSNEDKNSKRIASGLVFIPILIATIEKMDSNKFSLDDLVQIKYFSQGSGKVQSSDIGKKITVDELLTNVFKYSDNTCANLLIDLVGGFDEINNIMRSYNLNNIIVERKLMDLKAPSEGFDNYVTIHDLAMLMEKLYAKEILTPDNCDLALKYLAMSEKEGIKKNIKNAKVYHKIGLISQIFNDCGIVKTQKSSFIIIVMTQNTDRRIAEDIVAKISFETLKQLE